MAEELPRPVAFRGGGFAPRLRYAVGAATIIGLIALWAVASRRGWVSPIALPAPEEVATAFIRLARSGELARHLEASLSRLAAGFVLGTFAGIVVGLAIGLLSLARSAGVPLIVAAEMIGANTGIGAFILAAGNLMQTDQLVAGVLVLSLLGLVIAALIGAAERYLLRWR